MRQQLVECGHARFETRQALLLQIRPAKFDLLVQSAVSVVPGMSRTVEWRRRQRAVRIRGLPVAVVPSPFRTVASRSSFRCRCVGPIRLDPDVSATGSLPHANAAAVTQMHVRIAVIVRFNMIPSNQINRCWVREEYILQIGSNLPPLAANQPIHVWGN